MPDLAVGTQGWSYADWVGVMYDDGLRPDGYLRAYAREFASVEVDSTFYGTPPLERVAGWRRSVPAGFRFALKLPREITHERRLVASEAPLETFVASARGFEAALDGVLIQLPPDFEADRFSALAAFVQRLPAGVRWSLEVRHASWFARDMFARLHGVLEAAGCALAVSDGTFVDRATMLRAFAQPTAAHAYIRFLGEREAVDRYHAVVFDRRAQLAGWAAAITALGTQLKHVSAYANNHYSGHAPDTIRVFLAALGIAHRQPPRVEQISLF